MSPTRRGRRRAGQRRVAAAALAAVAVVAAVSAALTGPSGGASALAEPAAARTPVLSARRVPALIAGGVADAALRTQLDDLLTKAPPSTCLEVSIGGRVLYAHNAAEPLTPASNEKLLTGLAALNILGPDHRFTTQVVAAKGPTGGVVEGDLWLVGGGDPLLATAPFAAHFRDQPHAATSLESLADAVVRAGVKRIDGSVLGDESRYDSQRYVPAWPQRFITQNQTGPLSALTVNDNFTHWTTPEPLDGDPGATAAANPPVAAAATFAALLQARGVVITGRPGAAKAPPGAVDVARIDSPPLAQIVAEMFTESDNQTAETLTKELGLLRGGAGTTASGVAAITAELEHLGLPLAGSVRDDGSGLDANDKVTCQLLAAALDQAGPTSVLALGLPLGATSGTLRDRFVNAAGAGRVRAKTGSLTGISSLSGFVATVPGAAVTFSMIANGGTSETALERLEDAVANQLVTYPAGVDLAAAAPS